MNRKDDLTPNLIWCCDDHDGYACRAALPTIAKLAEHIAREHSRYYSKKSAMKRAQQRLDTTMECLRDDVFYALGFKHCISAWAPEIEGHFVRPESMNERYNCDDCLAKRAAEAA